MSTIGPGSEPDDGEKLGYDDVVRLYWTFVKFGILLGIGAIMYTICKYLCSLSMALQVC